MKDLRQRQMEFEAITENMGEGLIVTDNRGKILSYNKSAVEIFGNTELARGADANAAGIEGRLDEAVSEAIRGQRREFEWKQGGSVYKR